MESKDLKRIFEIDTLSEFTDFDQFSTLMEDVENVNEDMFYEILDAADASLLAELVEYYFEDIKQGVPDDSVEIYGMISVAGVNFKNRLKQTENHTDIMLCIDELFRFRQWYMREEQVTCRDLEKNTVEKVSICEALTRFRLEKLSEGTFDYDFSFCEEFMTDEYADGGEFNDDEEDDDEEDEYE